MISFEQDKGKQITLIKLLSSEAATFGSEILTNNQHKMIQLLTIKEEKQCLVII